VLVLTDLYSVRNSGWQPRSPGNEDVFGKQSISFPEHARSQVKGANGHARGTRLESNKFARLVLRHKNVLKIGTLQCFLYRSVAKISGGAWGRHDVGILQPRSF
jgi:hypothetical protein